MAPFDVGIWAFLATYLVCALAISFLMTLWGEEPGWAMLQGFFGGAFCAMLIAAFQWWTPVVVGGTWFAVVGWQAILKRVESRRR